MSRFSHLPHLHRSHFLTVCVSCSAVCLRPVRFTPNDISGQSQAKSSVQRNLRKAILETMPALEPHLDELIPKKLPLYVAKCQSHTNLILVNKEPLFIQLRDQHYLPTLRLLHRYPDIMRSVQVDRGAIKYVLKGADVMCPGLTSAGGRLEMGVAAETAVAIMAEGKEHAVAIGITKMSTDDMSAATPHNSPHRPLHAPGKSSSRPGSQHVSVLIVHCAAVSAVPVLCAACVEQ